MMTDQSSILAILQDFENKGYNDDIKYTTQLNWLFLKSIGVWPTTRASTFSLEINLFKLQIAFCYFLICFLFVPCALFALFDEEDTRIRVKLVGPMSYDLMVILKYTSLLIQTDTIKKCFNHVREDWKNIKHKEDRVIMLKYAKLGRHLVIYYGLFMYGGGIFYHLINPLSYGTIVTEDNVTIRPLGYPVYSQLMNAQISPIYEIVFAIQFVSGLTLYSVTVGACCLAALCVSHACGQLQVIISWLHDLLNGDRTRGATHSERMASIIQHHLRVLNFISLFERLLREICLVDFVGLIMNLCLLGYYFITEWEQHETIGSITYCVLWLSFTFHIFIFCFMGEILTEQCKQIGLTSYMIDWYRLPGKDAHGLILMSIISNSPTKITAGKLVDFSLESFCDVIKTSMAYLNLLRTLIT